MKYKSLNISTGEKLPDAFGKSVPFPSLQADSESDGDFDYIAHIPAIYDDLYINKRTERTGITEDPARISKLSLPGCLLRDGNNMLTMQVHILNATTDYKKCYCPGGIQGNLIYGDIHG